MPALKCMAFVSDTSHSHMFGYTPTKQKQLTASPYQMNYNSFIVRLSGVIGEWSKMSLNLQSSINMSALSAFSN